ncbi:MAG TPA: ATP-binding cassette domain-containing protein, partial [Solirubrobacterales bacterium]|nr:ATP-binding cassette domain-containing protein [Solirubrobacterales bacterium]
MVALKSPPDPVSRSAPAGREALLRLASVRRTFGRTVALDGVDLECRPGEVHTILGENGSGKSTLVKLISGVLPAAAGRVTIGDPELRPCTPTRARALGVAT